MKAVDRHLWQRFWSIATPYWRQEEKWKAWGLLALLVILLLGQTKFAVLFNEHISFEIWFGRGFTVRLRGGGVDGEVF